LTTKLPDHPNDVDLEQFILTQMPHFIATHYQRMLDAETLEERIRETLRTFELGLRALATILVGQYVIRDLDKVHSPELNELLLEKLRITDLNAWKEILFCTLQAYGGFPDLFFVSELYNFYWDTTYQPHRSRKDIEELFEKLVRLYNDTYSPHQITTQKSEAELAEMSRRALTLLHAVLEEFRFMRKYEVIKILEATRQGYLFERHTGLTIEHSARPLAASQELYPDHFYLLNKENDNTLALYPMVIFWKIQEMILGLYERLSSKKRVEYLLPLPYHREPHDDSDLFHDFIRQIIMPIDRAQEERRGIFSLSWPSLQKITHTITNQQTNTIREKYDPSLYQPRDATRHTFDDFLASNKTCFVLIGQSGVGKSNFVLALLDEFWQNRPEVCILAYNGATLESTQPLLQTLNTDLGKRFSGLKEANVLAEMARIPEISSGQGTLLVIIDAINENAQASDLLRQVDRLVRENEFPWLKIVLTSRPEAWRTMMRSPGMRLAEHKYYRARLQEQIGVELTQFADQAEGTRSLPTKQPPRYLTEQESPWVEMKPFTHNELQQAYERYQRRFNLKTPYEELTPTVRHALRDPLTLRLVAEINEGGEIPQTITITDITKEYVDYLVEKTSESLNREDIIFLERRLAPIMFGDDRVTNSINHEQLEEQGDELLALIHNEGYMTTGRRINQSYFNLVDAGILVKEEGGLDYKISFRYERFYDYFAGRYLFKMYKDDPDQIAFCESWVGRLNDAPFLWGALRNLLIGLLEEKKFELIEVLGNTTNVLQGELIVSVLREYYPRYQNGLKPILWRWLASQAEASQSPRITASVAIACLLEDVLARILAHHSEQVRFLVVQDIHELWQKDAALTTRLLHTLPPQISLLRVKRTRGIFTTLLYASVLLASRDYSGVGADTRTIEVVRAVWKPVLEKLFLVSRIGFMENGLKRLRRGLVYFFVDMVIRLIRNIEREGLTFNFKDVEAFFPASQRQKEVLERLTPHIDAAIGQAPAPVEAFTTYIEELDRQGDHNSVLVYAALLGFIAHYTKAPLRTAQAIDKLLDQLKKLNPPTKDPAQPAASLWYDIASYPFNFSPLSYLDMPREVAASLLKVFMKATWTCEFRYRGRFRLECGDAIRFNFLENLLFGYALGIPEAGRLALTAMVRFEIKQNDHEQLRWGPYGLAIAMERYKLPDAGVEALYDFIQLLRETSYLDRLAEEAQDAFWQAMADDLIKYTSTYQDRLLELLEKFEEHELPEAFKLRIRSAGRKDNITLNTGEAIAWALRDALADKNPFLRDSMKWLFCTATKVDSISELVVELIVYLVSLIYDGELFDQKDDPCQESLASKA
jgi:GTPase SAR1 family protein